MVFNVMPLFSVIPLTVYGKTKKFRYQGVLAIYSYVDLWGRERLGA